MNLLQKLTVVLITVIFSSMGIYADDPVAYYPFNGNANDESGNGNNGTVNGASLEYDMEGNENAAYGFDGIDDFIDMGSLGLTADYSIRFLLYPTYIVAGTQELFISNGSSSNNQFVLQADGSIGFDFWPADDLDSDPNSIADDYWYDVAITRNSVGRNIYINSVLVATGPANMQDDDADGWILGGQQIYGQYFYEGKIDEMYIYDREISQAEIDSLHELNDWGAVYDEQLVAYYPFNGNSNDESGNANHGTSNGGLVFVEDRFGIGTACSFDGIDDYILVDDSPLFPENAITMSYWIKRGAMPAILNNYLSKEHSFSSYMLTDGNFQSGFWKGVAGHWSGYDAAHDMENNLEQWIHYAITFDNSTMVAKSYINGSVVDSTFETDATAYLRSSSNPLYIGRNGSASTYFIEGALDDLYIYNSALTESEIDSLYHLNGWDDGLQLSLDIEEVIINGESLNISEPIVNIGVGESVTGSFTARFFHNSSEASVFPLAATPNWGAKESDYWQIASDMTNNSAHEGTISLTAPSEPGIYYILLASSGEFNAGQIVSATNWNMGELIWDNGDDFYDWSPDIFETAIAAGMVNVPYTLTTGQTNMNVAARAIKVVVGSSTVAYYPFNGNANDESGNGNSGVNNGATLTPDRFGNENSAFDFSNGSYIHVDDSPSIRMDGDYTLSAWIKPAETQQGAARIFSKAFTGASYHSYFLTLNQGNAGDLLPNVGAYNNSYLDATEEVIANEWHQIVGVLRGDSLFIYVDGVLSNERQLHTGSAIGYDSRPLEIGRLNTNTSQYFSGAIDDIRIHDYAISSMEIDSLYHLGGWPEVTSVEPMLASKFRVNQNYPNPFNPTTSIRYSLPHSLSVSVIIYDITGHEVVTVMDKSQNAGSHQIVWSGLDMNGQHVGTGVYFAKILAGDYSQTIKMLLLK